MNVVLSPDFSTHGFYETFCQFTKNQNFTWYNFIDSDRLKFVISNISKTVVFYKKQYIYESNL